jgi:hypothetical protein
VVFGVTQTNPATPMIELYDSLHAKGVSQRQKLNRAEGFASDPMLLAAAFAESVAVIERYPPRDEGFYRSRRRYALGDVKAASTTDLAFRVRDAGGLTITSGTGWRRELPTGLATRIVPHALSCDYLDRELVATRTTGRAVHAGTAVRLDLLLANRSDRTPIVAEIKRTSDSQPKATDKDPFSALVQALACVSQLASPAQYARLARRGAATRHRSVDVPGQADIALVTPPKFDVYVVLHNRPGGTHQVELAEVTEELAVGLLGTASIARHVRRIAGVITCLDDGGLVVAADWAYERPVPKTAKIEAAFARYLAPFAIALPGAACLQHADGSLRARGWSVRWRWRDEALEFRASHRMTNERWHLIAPDGTLTGELVPSEMMVVGPDDDPDQVEAEYRSAWRAHGAAIIDAGMTFDTSVPEHAWTDDARMTWTLDGASEWHVTALPPRPD